MKKKFCPILLIGFPAPKKGEKDIRLCTEECALFDEESKQCGIMVCAETMPVLSGQIDDLIAVAGGFVPFEDDENFEYNPNTIGTSH